MPSWWIWMNCDSASIAVADGGLLANDQRHRAKVRQAAAIGHPQTEFVDAGGCGGSFQQAAETGDRDAKVRAIEAGDRKPGLSQHRYRVEPDGPGDLGIMRQAGAADQVGHAVAFRAMSRNVK